MKRHYFFTLSLVCLAGTTFGAITSLQDAKAKFSQVFPTVFPPQNIVKAQVPDAEKKWKTYFDELRGWMQNDFFKKTYGLLKQNISKSNQDSLLVSVDVLNKDGADLLHAIAAAGPKLAAWKRPMIEQIDRTPSIAVHALGDGGELTKTLITFAPLIKREDIAKAIEAVVRAEIFLDVLKQVTMSNRAYVVSVKNMVKKNVEESVGAIDTDNALTGQAWGNKMISYIEPFTKLDADLNKALQSFERSMAQLKKDLVSYTSDFAETKDLKAFLMLIATELERAFQRVKKDAQALKG